MLTKTERKTLILTNNVAIVNYDNFAMTTKPMLEPLKQKY